MSLLGIARYGVGRWRNELVGVVSYKDVVRFGNVRGMLRSVGQKPINSQI